MGASWCGAGLGVADECGESHPPTLCRVHRPERPRAKGVVCVFDEDSTMNASYRATCFWDGYQDEGGGGSDGVVVIVKGCC
jgi:hypothetical protein